MKLQILQENLDKAVNIASRFASSKAQLPILGNILLSAEKTKLIVSSTNLEVSVSTEVGAKVEEEGTICVPARIISELTSNLPKETILLTSAKEQLKVSTSGFSSNILGINSADFPKIPSVKGGKSGMTLPKDELITSLSKVIYAISVDETRPVLTGVLFIFSKEGISLVATDGFRLSWKNLSTKVNGVEFRLVVPKLVLTELSRLGESTESLIFKYLEIEKQILFGAGDVTLSSRLLEGEYPDFEKIIPKKSSIQVRVDKEDALRAVKLASIFARESANIVKLKILEDSVRFSAESSAAGSQTTDIEAKVESEIKDFEIAFNFRFLEDFLHSVVGEEVVMEFSGVNAPGVFRDQSDTSYLHLIMPVKVQG